MTTSTRRKYTNIGLFPASLMGDMVELKFMAMPSDGTPMVELTVRANGDLKCDVEPELALRRLASHFITADCEDLKPYIGLLHYMETAEQCIRQLSVIQTAISSIRGAHHRSLTAETAPDAEIPQCDCKVCSELTENIDHGMKKILAARVVA